MAKLKTLGETKAARIGDEDDVEPAEPDLRGDWTNLLLLMLLYVMQGVPLGISHSIPILIQSNKNVTYSDQTVFSFAGYPYSLKIFWAPIIDAIYVQKFGRRKSWVVPLQYISGMILIYTAWEIDNLLPGNGKPDVVSLMCVFFSTSFLAATQDIAVDGWSLTMLKKNNVGYASICNSTGQAIGKVLGSMPLMLLTSEDFCNKYLRITPVHGVGGVVSMKTLIYGWGIMFLMITSLIAIFKKENYCTLNVNHVKVNVLQTYSQLWYIAKLPSIHVLAIILVTVKIGFMPADSDIVSLKLIDAGVSKDTIAMINSALIVFDILTPIAIAKLVSGRKAMNVYLQTVLFRLPLNVAFALLTYYTSQLSTINGIVQIPTHYYAFLVVTFVTQTVLAYTMFIALQSFFSQISDARFGGTYMTLLNTCHNFGNKWTSTAALALLDLLSSKKNADSPEDIRCPIDLQKARGIFSIPVDGYYVEIFLCTVVGIAWYYLFRNKIKTLKNDSLSNWLVDVKSPARTENADNTYSATEMSIK